MATNPASVADAVSTAMNRRGRRSFADVFRDFLSQAPEEVSTEFLRGELLGKGKGFMTTKEIQNRVTTAQAAGHLGVLKTSADGERRMRNNLAKKRGIAAAAKRVNGGAKEEPAAPRKSEGAFLAALVPWMDEAEDVANLALVSEEVSRDQLIEAMRKAAGAFNGLLRKHSLNLDS
jgi:hypothetical protein